MGTTLASCHVYGQKTEVVRPLLEEGYIPVSLSEGWTSVLSRAGDCELSDKTAKKLSKALDAPVLSFLYFDDDLMTLVLFSGGRLGAQYRMDYGAEPYLAHCDAFAEALGWEKKRSERLRLIFKCSDLDEKIALLEEFFGVALRVCTEFIGDGAEEYMRSCGDTLYRAYEEKQKKLNRITNQTRAVLTQEMDAKLACGQPCIAVRRAEGEDTYDSDMGEALELVGDVLQPKLGNFRMRSFSPKLYTSREWVTIADVMGVPLRVSHNGQTLSRVPLTEGVNVAAVLDNGDIIGVAHHGAAEQDEGCMVLRITPRGDMVWRVTLDGMFFRVLPVRNGASLYCGVCRFDSGEGMLMKLGEDGRIQTSLQTPYVNSHTELRFHDGWIYYLGDYWDGSCHNVLLKLDESLRIVETEEAPAGISIYSDAYFDRRHGRVYYNALDKRIVRFDLAEMRYTVATTDDEIYLQLADEDGHIYGVSGFSTLCVLDADMKLISRHRLKGTIFDVCRSEMGVHALTATGDMAAWGFPEPPCYVRVYRIGPA
jgi:hypothetical protein